MEFNIGNRVRVKDYKEIPSDKKALVTGGDPTIWNAGKAKTSGKVGTIVDKMYSERYSMFVYRIQFDGQDVPSNAQFDADSIEPYTEEVPEYSWDIEVTDNIAIVRMYATIGGVKSEVTRGHGHLIHEGIEGIAQAVSYAFKRIYTEIPGGEMLQRGE